MEKIRGLQSGGVDFKQRQIERRIDGDDARRIDLAARERDIDFAGGDDMIIGHDEAVGRDDDAGADIFDIDNVARGAPRGLAFAVENADNPRRRAPRRARIRIAAARRARNRLRQNGRQTAPKASAAANTIVTACANKSQIPRARAATERAGDWSDSTKGILTDNGSRLC